MDEDSQKSLLYCSLLAMQFGLQPILASMFTADGISKTSIVIATELGKILIALVAIFMGPSSEREKIHKNWSVSNSLKIAAVPATLYAIQNLMVQYAYVHLDSMTFNLFNQTKTLSAAFWLWIILGKRQSGIQMFALLLLLSAAIILNLKGAEESGGGSGAGDSRCSRPSQEYELGLMMVGGASMLSGLSAALTQRALIGSSQRHPLFLSAELAVYGIIFLLGNLHFNSDLQGESTWLFSNWDILSLIPVATNAFGGVVVGLVTKYAGGVVKGFALIAGIIITGIAQWLIHGKPLGAKHLAGIVLVSASIYLHASFPYKLPSGHEQTMSKKKEE